MYAAYHVKAKEINQELINILEKTYHDQELVIVSRDEYNQMEKARHNIEYLAKIDKAARDIEDGKGISVTMEQLEAMENG
ncbi:hypothetical protein TREPR_2620 [Treponema primitia ZAS-2]|uniref:Prevent-host-death family protein n=1 Tax=Treponema primitia (strain ATCC BAA-887 / DSM 12427 / ZAS-2) TaxID=545694 RepID=F5YRB2_TREPZ|nr:hypothetical protein [Treponema primitia]AEF84661.1 hypothetical protein TREPR_2620 [Treponema primitia ZAS-2]